MSFALYICVVLVLGLLSASMAHRDGARTSESCYDHNVIHDNPDLPPTFKQRCFGNCGYDLLFAGEVDMDTLMLIDSNVPPNALICGRVYEFTLSNIANQGYFIQARTTNADNAFIEGSDIWGEWLDDPAIEFEPEPFYKPVACGRNMANPSPLFDNSVTHANLFNDPQVSLYWRAPTFNGETLNITFTYTIAAGFSTFYFPQFVDQMTVLCNSTEPTTAEPTTAEPTTPEPTTPEPTTPKPTTVPTTETTVRSTETTLPTTMPTRPGDPNQIGVQTVPNNVDIVIPANTTPNAAPGLRWSEVTLLMMVAALFLS